MQSAVSERTRWSAGNSLAIIILGNSLCGGTTGFACMHDGSVVSCRNIWVPGYESHQSALPAKAFHIVLFKLLQPLTS